MGQRQRRRTQRAFFVSDLKPVRGRSLRLARQGMARLPTEEEARAILRSALCTLALHHPVLADDEMSMIVVKP